MNSVLDVRSFSFADTHSLLDNFGVRHLQVFSHAAFDEFGVLLPQAFITTALLVNLVSDVRRSSFALSF